MGKIKRALSLAVGTVADFAMPHLGDDIDAARNNAQAARLKRVIIQARMRRAQKSKDADGLQEVLTSFWRSATGDTFHAGNARDSFERFLNNHTQAIEGLDQFVLNSQLGFSRMVEIGCGNGWLLDYCAEKLPWITEAVGIDVNASAIERAAAAQPPGSPLRFVCADPQDWLAEHPKGGTVLVSNGGVLEYFTQDNFDRLLATLGRARPAALLLLEPVDVGHDLDRRSDSYAFTSAGWCGSETTFSHNHRVRLQQAGFEIVFAEEIHFDHQPGVMMLGVLR